MLIFTLAVLFSSTFTYASEAHYFVPTKPIYIPQQLAASFLEVKKGESVEKNKKSQKANSLKSDGTPKQQGYARILVIAKLSSPTSYGEPPCYDKFPGKELVQIFYRQYEEKGKRLVTSEFEQNNERFTFIHIEPGVFFADNEIEQIAPLLAPGGMILFFAAFAAVTSTQDSFINVMRVSSRGELLSTLEWVNKQRQQIFLIRFVDKSPNGLAINDNQ